jgi:hypothetical protein
MTTKETAAAILALAEGMAHAAPKRGWLVACKEEGFSEQVAQMTASRVREMTEAGEPVDGTNLVGCLAAVGLSLVEVVNAFVFAKPGWGSKRKAGRSAVPLAPVVPAAPALRPAAPPPVIAVQPPQTRQNAPVRVTAPPPPPKPKAAPARSDAQQSLF